MYIFIKYQVETHERSVTCNKKEKKKNLGYIVWLINITLIWLISFDKITRPHYYTIQIKLKQVIQSKLFIIKTYYLCDM